jgi:hypothetical protein
MPKQTLTLAVAAVVLALALPALSPSALAQTYQGSSNATASSTGSFSGTDGLRDGATLAQANDGPATTGSTSPRDPKEPNEPAGGSAPGGAERSDTPRETDATADLPIPQRRPVAAQRTPQPPIPRVTQKPPARAGAPGKACGSVLCPPFIILGIGL